ncbi:Gram-negative bacteria-binding protein 1 [Lucilia cuprina]|uniref:Gram-negative bacteria-binding protein 1 n=1 Tax=Lucilia cuprina TaxID=7375 RepID=A0A0L0BXK5_LUCCU|nr:Gram-negative bacteria-binding protein 1 [Lucilia cuprina]KNC23994.1 Gram-negative bacteria-binding protein 1 [Lucilia cuprina]
MYRNLLSIVLLVNLAGWGCTFTIQPAEFNIIGDKFTLSIPNDPDIKWVSFHVNINKEFRSFETGQYSGTASIPQNKKWTVEFDKKLQDKDIVYVWMAVQHNRLIFRDKKDPISVEAFRSGNPNYRITTTAPDTSGESSTESSTKGTIDVTLENKICRPTVSEVPRSFGGPYCRDDLIFSDNFDTLNTKYWTNEVRFPPTIDDAEFVLYNGTANVEGGILRIEASLNSKNLKKDTIDLGHRCTSINVDSECSLTPRGVSMLPPIISGRLSTKNHFRFKYGRIEVRAKLPIGDWLYPLISLQPSTPTYGDHYKSGEMRVAFARGNHELKWQNKNINGGRLFGGVILNKNAELRHQFMKDTTMSNVEHFGEQFHLYTLTWKPDELILTVDGNEYGRIKTNFKEIVNEPIWNKGEANAPLDQMFYITLGLAAGGNGDFPNTENQPWSNTDPRGSLNFFRNRDIWFPTWSQPALEVDYVRVYAV